jgi:hypothetical protein
MRCPDNKDMRQLTLVLYLMFQIFSSGGDPSSTASPSAGDFERVMQDVLTHIGTRGDAHHKLGFFIGPITLDNSDADVKQQIAQSFELARKHNVAIGFHLDDHMFWGTRGNLTSNKDNIEWTDWNGTLSVHRRLDWGPEPMFLGPQMCFNSPGIKVAVSQRAQLIGREIKKELDRLKSEHREDLFAGVICGWESQMGCESSTGRIVGYHALTNAGFNPNNSPEECEAGLARILQSFMELWAANLAQAGVPRNKLFCHIGFMGQGFEQGETRSALQEKYFLPPSVAFSPFYRPGFSTYPSDDTIEQVRKTVADHGNPPWISAEGTNIVPDGFPGEANMETYLGKMFNHGAVLVNIFSWGIGGEAERNKNMFRKVTENAEAINAYRKFLSGAALKEQPRPVNQFSPQRLQQKIHTIQTQIPLWVQRTHRPDLIQPLMTKLDAAIKSGRVRDADTTADQILQLIK